VWRVEKSFLINLNPKKLETTWIKVIPIERFPK